MALPLCSSGTTCQLFVLMNKVTQRHSGTLVGFPGLVKNDSHYGVIG